MSVPTFLVIIRMQKPPKIEDRCAVVLSKSFGIRPSANRPDCEGELVRRSQCVSGERSAGMRRVEWKPDG